MSIFGTRFAGDHLAAAYNAVDNQFGGILPGGVETDGVQLVKDVALDALPGTRVHGGATAGKASSTAGDFATGRADVAATRARGGKAGGKVREHLVEEGIERIGREAVERIATRGGAYAIPVAGQVLATTDMVRDGMDALDTVVQINTGKGIGQHVDQTIAMRDNQSAANQLFPTASYVGEGTHEVGQGTKRNPFMQELQNRATQVVNRFNPLHGDFGVSEAMGWN